jgi:tetratricopeptide (TPR) repeat protein
VSYLTITRLNYERMFLDSLHVALDRAGPARGSLVYASHAPLYTRFVTMDGRAPKVWFDDPGLEFRMVSDYHPGEPRAHVFLRFDGATRGFEQVPNDVMDASVAAEAAMDAQRPGEARTQIDRALALLPGRGLRMVRLDLLGNRGSACAAIGDTAEARACWRQALALDPAFASAALNLARLDAGAGRLASARETLQELLSHVPADADALSLLVRVEWSQGDYPAAQEALVRLGAVDPGQASGLQERLRSTPPPAPTR